MTAAAVDQDRLARLDRQAKAAGVSLEHDAPLAPLTTLRVGGPADRMAVATSVEELVALHRLADESGVPVFLLGKGSDLVVADAGIRGLVIRVRADGVRLDGERVHAEAGVSMTGLAKRCAREGLAGFDWGISIPGTVGGAIWANAGAHDGEMSHVVSAVHLYDPRDAQRRRIDVVDCAFAYRDSRFKHSPEVVLAAELSLTAGDPVRITERIDEHQDQRRATQPLADQNAGSVFRNPPGDHAGRLIEAAGLKGERVGTAQVSTLHANFIVTDRGSGHAADVRALGDRVRAAVADRFGVELRYEIEFVGEWDGEAAE
jgi:UDP-N-acetylmuramate dehydrogenase